jgi:hypothetical protein
MFCQRRVTLFVAAIAVAFSNGVAYAAPAAFSDDGNHVYLLGSALRHGSALDIDLTNSTATKLSLGVTAEVRAITNAPRALLFVTEKALYRLPLPSGEVRKICDAPAGCLFHDVACNRPQHGILLLGRTKDGRDWPAYYLKEQSSTPAPVVTRRVQALASACFDREGHLFFVSNGDVWEGSVEPPSELDDRWSVEADRFAPVALLETANTTPNSTGAHELAVAGHTIYTHMRRMDGSGWGEMISVRWPGEPKGDSGSTPSVESPVKRNIELFKLALGALRVYGDNARASYLCGSSDGRKVFFALRGGSDSAANNALRFYVGDEAGEVHPLDQLKVTDPK